MSVDPAEAGAAEAVLGFWLGEPQADGFPPEAVRRRWFAGGASLDRDIRERFGFVHAAAAAGRLDDWAAEPRGRLALILVLDQFSRHIHRGTAAAFAQDGHARRLCEAGLARGDDAPLSPAGRAFFYMPLQHAEDLAAQDRAVDLYRAMHEALAGTARRKARSFLDHARQHREIVARFGRFPHRNALLGRPSTAAEAAWLARTGRTFGQQRGGL